MKGPNDTNGLTTINPTCVPLLFQAIFSDDSDEEEDALLSQTAIQAASVPGSLNKRAEAADAALNRLVAGDFLESLGKELGLKVPDIHRPSVAKPIAKVMDDGSFGRGRREHEFKGTILLKLFCDGLLVSISSAP